MKGEPGQTRRARPPATPHFRPDLNGLRALAIVPVVAFHAGIPGFSGGFTGVDVFFAISGFLITSNLLREVDRTGGLHLGAFWAARLRRLAPALCVMIAVTLVAGLIVLSPLEWATLGEQSAAAAVYASNVLFAAQSSDYFAASIDQSPLLHTWTLGVEEQFYIFWPLLIVTACVLARRRGVSPRGVIVTAFAVTLVASFVLSLWLTDARPTWAFYLLPTRAWEFAAAGLVAVLPLGRLAARLAPLQRQTLSLVGLVLVLGAVFLLNNRIPFPGFAAIVPVLGTLLLIVAGTPGDRPSDRPGDQGPDSQPVLVSHLLGAGPLQWIGSRSYSWYLWHWPAIVFAFVLLRTDSAVVGSVAGIGSLILASASYAFVEQRVRFNTRLLGSVRLTVASMAVSAAVIVALSGGVAMIAGASTTSATFAPYQAAVVARGVSTCAERTTEASGIRYCEDGDASSKKTVMLVGDSHAGMWQNALGAAAQAEGYRLVTRWLSACPAIPVAVVNAQGVHDPACTQFRTGTVRLMGEVKPQMVVIVNANSYVGRIVDGSGQSLETTAQAHSWAAAYSEFVAQIRGFGALASSIEDNPQLSFDPVLCLTRALGSEARCSSDRGSALATTRVLRTAEAVEVEALHMTARFATVPLICGSESCRVLAGTEPIFADQGHLSAAFTRLQVPDLRLFLRRTPNAQ
ncbi:acyltransferase family protein [Cryobacterium sp. CG_9.6]|uniref:acyltransferase family protein n=1 Tax=Cryobacterium sp. CG_9.6 TaxID=2760710 RepID=UPI002475227D|nr:acyltransferase family protein [Cryobacterium sp. CG_9.6]MDH6235812.1 peptidoglycan/LPS O-acetylase OafA/YrhL [Cryobacterium sp. CG_9.6]